MSPIWKYCPIPELQRDTIDNPIVDSLSQAIPEIIKPDSVAQTDSAALVDMLPFQEHVFSYGQIFHLDKWDWVACSVALLSLIVAVFMALWQWRTERNTMKITKEGQVGVLIDYIRHFYCNLVVMYAISHKMKDEYSRIYPSQEHFRKLTIDLKALHPDAFFRHKEKYQAVHNLLLLSRNYNSEIEVAELHICDKDMWEDAKKRDLSTLMLKPNLLAKNFFDCIRKIAPRKYRIGSKKDYTGNIRETIIDAAIRRATLPERFTDDNNQTTNPKKLASLRTERIEWMRKEGKKLNYYNEELDKCNFANLFFRDDPELFYSLVNFNIDQEIKGYSTQNGLKSPKIFMIPFPGHTLP